MQYPTISEYVNASQDANDNLDMSTEATNAELNEAITDAFGAKYSKDGRKLLKVPQKLDGTYPIRKGTKIICDRAFADCKSLRSIVIPDGVTSIGNGAFCGCKSLSSLVFPDSVTSIGHSAFSGCDSLESLVLPESVGNIIGNPFCGWYGELKCLSPYFIYANKVLFDKDKSKIIAFRDKKTTSYVIPDSVTRIGDSAFEDCKSLTDIVIPNSVTSIGDGAFDGCESLKSLVIPDGVTSIGERAFYGCNFPNDIEQELSSRFGKGIFELSYGLFPNYYGE